MMGLTVREYARLTTEPVGPCSLDTAVIPVSAFEWLSERCAEDARLGVLRGRKELQLKSLVGVLTTPCGLQLEILPKTQREGDDVRKSREQLIRMLTRTMEVDCLSVSEAEVSLFELPLSEWVARQFLLKAHQILKQGLRFDYTRVEEEARFLKGQLNMSRQVRQLPHRLHRFHLCYDVFAADRPENRLLRSALEKVTVCVSDEENRRLASLLRRYMACVPESRDIRGDFSRWSHDRLMAGYEVVRPWCELVLGSCMPYAVADRQQGISMLFSIHSLFERYVAQALRAKLVPGARLETKPQGKYLCCDRGSGRFSLEPDIVVHYGQQTWILDTKWKRLESEGGGGSISISDIYQLYAYGRQWLHGQGCVSLVYPEHETFPHPQRPLNFTGENMQLCIASFDLSDDRLICPSEAGKQYPWLKE